MRYEQSTAINRRAPSHQKSKRANCTTSPPPPPPPPPTPRRPTYAVKRRKDAAANRKCLRLDLRLTNASKRAESWSHSQTEGWRESYGPKAKAAPVLASDAEFWSPSRGIFTGRGERMIHATGPSTPHKTPTNPRRQRPSTTFSRKTGATDAVWRSSERCAHGNLFFVACGIEP